MDPQTLSRVFRHLSKSFDELADIIDPKQPDVTVIEPLAAEPTSPAPLIANGALAKTKQPKDKDPNAPKRPPSGYNLFFQETATRLSSERPGIVFQERGRIIGEMWKTADHSKYEERAKKLKEAYTVQMEEYEAEKAPSPSASSTFDSNVASANTEAEKKKKKKKTEDSSSSTTASEEPSKKKSKTKTIEAASAPTSSPSKSAISDSQSTVVSAVADLSASTVDGKKKKKNKEIATTTSSN
jgi:high mobility group protein B3